MNDPFDEEAALKEVGRIGTRIDAIVKKIAVEDPGRPADPEPVANNETESVEPADSKDSAEPADSKDSAEPAEPSDSMGSAEAPTGMPDAPAGTPVTQPRTDSANTP